MRYLLILAILLYDILTEARYRIHRVNDDEVQDVNEMSRRHHRHIDWRKKALVADQEKLQNEEDSVPITYHYTYVDRGDSINPQWRQNPAEMDEEAYMKLNMHEIHDAFADIDKRSSSSRLQSVLNKERERRQVTEADCTGTNERFESCFSGCAAVSCDNPRHRLRLCYPFCEPGCVCAEPYVRDDRTHKCVFIQDCTMSLKGIPDIEGE